jgi:hypothetical protein
MDVEKEKCRRARNIDERVPPDDHPLVIHDRVNSYSPLIRWAMSVRN